MQAGYSGEVFLELSHLDPVSLLFLICRISLSMYLLAGRLLNLSFVAL